MALEEAGADYELELVRFMKGQHKSADYLALNPSGKVPLLITPEGPLAENVAIARYLAQTFDGLLPKAENPYEEARITSNLSFCSATLHPIVTRMRMPMFIANGTEARDSVRQKAIEAMKPHAAQIDQIIGAGPWWYGDRWSIQDAYIYWIWYRVTNVGFPGEDYPNWSAHAARMENRPSVQRALARDGEMQEALEAEGLAPLMR